MAKRQTGFLILSAVTVLLIAGCVKAPFSPPMGLITSVKVPLQFELKEGGTPLATASGSASSLYFHDILITGAEFAWNDCSVQKAAQNGGLRSVSYADYDYFLVLGVFGRTTVTAYGPRSQ